VAFTLLAAVVALGGLVLTAATQTATVSADSGTVRVGVVHEVGAWPFVYEPVIAVDPTDSDRLAAAYITSSDFACDRTKPCQVAVALAASADAGATWQEWRLTPFPSGDPAVAYASDGTLYAVGLGPGSVVLRRDLLEHDATLPDLQLVANASGPDKPWVTVAPDSGELYVSYSASTSDGRGAILLRRSADQGDHWTAPVSVVRELVVFERGTQLASQPWGAQVLLGSGEPGERGERLGRIGRPDTSTRARTTRTTPTAATAVSRSVPRCG
jgi:hypothetical protein